MSVFDTHGMKVCLSTMCWHYAILRTYFDAQDFCNLIFRNSTDITLMIQCSDPAVDNIIIHVSASAIYQCSYAEMVNVAGSYQNMAILQIMQMDQKQIVI